jgi:hypothetical protein
MQNTSKCCKVRFVSGHVLWLQDVFKDWLQPLKLLVFIFHPNPHFVTISI